MIHSALNRMVFTIVVIVATMLGSTATVLAYNTASYWNTSGTPLQVTGFGSTAKAYGYIKIFNGSNGTRMYSHAWNQFTDADNHSAYTENQAQYNAGTCRTWTIGIEFKGVMVNSSGYCAQQFYDYGSSVRVDGLNYTSSTWSAMPNTDFGVNTSADRGRLIVTLGIDVPWRSDPLSGPSISDKDSW